MKCASCMVGRLHVSTQTATSGFYVKDFAACMVGRLHVSTQTATSGFNEKDFASCMVKWNRQISFFSCNLSYISNSCHIHPSCSPVHLHLSSPAAITVAELIRVSCPSVWHKMRHAARWQSLTFPLILAIGCSLCSLLLF